MSFFRKLVDETQISKPAEATRHHNIITLLILLPLRAYLFYILHYETPCRSSTWPVRKQKSHHTIKNNTLFGTFALEKS